MLTHPFENLTDRRLRSSCLLMFLAWVLATAVLVATIPMRHLLTAMQLAGSADFDSAQWPNDLRISIAYLIGFDFLYDLLHNNAVALLAVLAARRARVAWLTRAARTVAWVMWLNTALNLIENTAFLSAVRGELGWLVAAQWIEAFRSSSLGVGLIFGLVVLVVARFCPVTHGHLDPLRQRGR